MSDAPNLDDLHAATGGLHALLCCIYEVSTEIQYVRADGSRCEPAERLSHLIILARDEAERIDQSVEPLICADRKRAWYRQTTRGERND